VNRDRIAHILSETGLFGCLLEDTLGEIAGRAMTRRLQKSDILFHQGDAGGSLFVVAEGTIKLYLISEMGDEIVLATVRRPDMFGELAVLDAGPRSASARALEDSLLISLTREAFTELMVREPNLNQAVVASLGALVRRSLEQASDLVFLDLPGRVAKILLSLASDVSAGEDGTTLLDLHFTQSTLAGMVGGSRPSVNQILKSFEGRGYLELHGRRVLIKRADLLERRAAL
jgi:CRP/FNR family transcriptional regulator, cyclic AMP receptor protein